jgi:small-conductance mechanosensitive channel
MELWEHLRYLEVSWTGLFVMVLAFAAVIALRRWLPEGRRDRGRFTVVLAGVVPVLHLVATGIGLAGAPSFSATLHMLNVVIALLAITGAVGLVVFDVILSRTRVPVLARDLTQLVAFVALVILALRFGGLDPLHALAQSAVITAVIGLALQAILGNVLAGIVLHVDRTLSLGDWIQIGPRVGQIVEISWRASRLLTRDGDTALVPNAQLLTNEVLNLSRPHRGRRTIIHVPMHRKHAPADVAQCLLGALAGVDGVVQTPQATCAPVDFASGTVVYALTYWVDDVARENAIEGATRANVWYAAEKAGLDLCPGR